MPPPLNPQISLPYDIALKIVSSLPAFDVCSLGSCSRFWRDFCGSDCVWEGLCKERWPEIFRNESYSAPRNNQSLDGDHEMVSNSQGWKNLYISRHCKMAANAAIVTNFMERAIVYETNSIEVGSYLKALDLLSSYQFGFKDIQTFFLKPDLNVLINLLGLHFCIVWLDISADEAEEAINSRQISDRRVGVKWWKLGRWLYGFRLRDELHSRNVSLRELAVCGEEILGVLHRGAIHEIFRVQISAANPVQKPSSFQV